MSYDLNLGFKEKPKDLEVFLTEQGFRFDSLVTRLSDEDPEMKVYRDGTFRFTYSEELDRGKQRGEPHNLKGIVATATLETSLGDNETIKRQRDLGKLIRDHYNAVLKDPQEGKLIKD